MNSRRLILAIAQTLVATSAVAGQPETTPVTNIEHSAVFDKMKALVGEYQEVADADESARVSYQLISNGSALTETWNMASGKKELTVFHMDQDELVATHYCAANIQSTMALSSLSEDGVYNFRLRSISNLPSAESPHNSGFGYRFSDDKEIFRNEIWSRAGEESVSDLMLARLPEDPKLN
ncbi:MAG: hypothetical protein AB8G17_11180 [Gammaproteobacteria bacterium]